VNAQPRSSIAVNHTWTRQQEWKGDKYAEAEKNATKIGIKHGSTKFDVSAANDKWSFKSGQPLVTDDWKVNGSVAVEGKPAKNETKVTVASDITTPDFSGVKAFMNLSVESTWKDINSETDTSKPAKLAPGFTNPEIKFDANINFEKDFYLGAAIEHDSKKVTESAVSFVKKDAGDKYWFTYNTTKSVVGAGCLINYGPKGFKHAYEGKFNHANDARAQLWGQPLSIAAGGKYELSPETAMTYSLEFGKNVSAQAKFDHKLDSHWKVSIQQAYDCNRLDSKRPPYDLGFNVAYTL